MRDGYVYAWRALVGCGGDRTHDSGKIELDRETMYSEDCSIHSEDTRYTRAC